MPLLRNLPTEIRTFAGLVMLVLAIGYAHALAYVYVSTRIVPRGIEERYLGTEQAPADSSATAPTENQPPATITGELQYEKTLPEMLNIIHTHILTMCFIFALSGLITFMTDTLPRRLRKFAIIEPFVGIIATFAGLWLMRYAHHSFSYLVSLSGTVMAIAFGLQCYAVVRELMISRKVIA